MAWSKTRPTEPEGTYGNSNPKRWKESQDFLGIINYIGSPSTVNMCEPLGKLTSSKTLWT